MNFPAMPFQPQCAYNFCPCCGKPFNQSLSPPVYGPVTSVVLLSEGEKKALANTISDLETAGLIPKKTP
jgi:hypothetical protein